MDGKIGRQDVNQWAFTVTGHYAPKSFCPSYLGYFPLYRIDWSETTRTNQGKMEGVGTKPPTKLILG